MTTPPDAAARALAAAVAAQVGALVDPDALNRLAALVARGLADGALLSAVDVSDAEPPAGDRPQDVIP
jgi:hypothetical protein